MIACTGWVGALCFWYFVTVSWVTQRI